MFPATSVGRAWRRSSSPVSAVGGALPLVPGLAITAASITRRPSPRSPVTAPPPAAPAARPASPHRPPGAVSPELEGGEREERQQERQDPDPHDDLGPPPALHLVVVMKRRHEEAAPPEELEGAALDDEGDRLDHVDPADEGQQQLGL